MNEDKVNRVIAQWVRLGAMFNTSASQREVDLERLLLDTARCAATHSRLFILAVSWLARYGQYVAKHRLAQLIARELENEYRQAMGLLLELAREKGARNSHRFNRAIEACGRTIDERPLLDVDRRNDFFVQKAKENASALSLKWGRWMEDFALKDDAIRPASWIVKHNRSLQYRADFKGDLRASILAELESNSAAGESESELARACGVTRAALIDALDKLVLSGRIRLEPKMNRMTIRRLRRNAA